MTLASDPFGSIPLSGQHAQARPARRAGEVWRGVQRLCSVVLHPKAEPRSMAEASWQAGFAAMWDQKDLPVEGDAAPAERVGPGHF
ncbi:hypothetical protein [Paracoccus lutimaris]|uniref:Uncharacterized protein n=1 Tax=Paracoccus lutimaris TaxID=1490030 RepID=A0A368YWD9_9RHOB|nr:hypothetical protein [Paracoccus lutimaris]RCW82504.1 hypothetical protein DFP89_112101 [Paracoccus lutimaris]